MNKRRIKSAVLLTSLVGLIVVGACGLWPRSYRRQEALDRQLIAALKYDDPKQALALVNAGADPNTPVEPPQPPSLTRFWNHLIHRTNLPDNDGMSAFHLACGAYYFSDVDFNWSRACLNTDEPHLVEIMLQHGAQKNAQNGRGQTPLMWSIGSGGHHLKTADVLLKHGADVNAQDFLGGTALFYPSCDDPSVQSAETNIVRQLLAHGADPDLANMNGTTPLQLAQRANRPDLVALLKQAGAKK